MSISSKWNEKKEDRRAGLSFDWRFLVPSGWKLIYFCLPILMLGLGFLAWLEVRSDTSLEKNPGKLGNIFYLREEEGGKLASFLSRNIPFAGRGPVWADPASLGVDSDVFTPIQGGLNSTSTELELSVPPGPRGELDHLADSLVLLPADVAGHQFEAVRDKVEVRPSVSRMGASLAGFVDGEGYPSVSGRPDMGGFETVFWIVVNEWGKPENVLVVGESGDLAIDDLAEGYVRTLRWEPSRNVRSGELRVGWKEVDVANEP